MLIFKSNSTFQNKACKFSKYYRHRLNQGNPVNTYLSKFCFIHGNGPRDRHLQDHHQHKELHCEQVLSAESAGHSAPLLQVPLKSALYSPLAWICEREILTDSQLISSLSLLQSHVN